jgi:AraC family transcriptional regulator of adaptative response/methylated-DNA-[protein]-cysteine methyltransferase
MTFHAYSRARRLGEALGRIHEGEGVARTAFDAGYDSLSGFNEAVRRFAGDAPTASKDARIVRITRIPTPLGPMVAAADDDGVCFLEFADRRALSAQIRRLNRRAPSVFVPGPNPVLERLATELEEYFAGVRHRFDVPVHPRGTAFQERVWEALREIPAGETRSYSEVARAIGRPRSVRAVARANGANPISILVPCHRVIGADGSLTGYGGGLWRKQRLLDLERDFGRSGEESPERHRDRAKNGDDPPRDRRPSHWLPE